MQQNATGALLPPHRPHPRLKIDAGPIGGCAERLSLGLTEGWVRLSVGLEAAEDLERDLSRALDQA